MHIVVILVVGVTNEVRTLSDDAPLLRQMNLQHGIDNQESGIALVALGIQIAEVVARHFLELVFVVGDRAQIFCREFAFVNALLQWYQLILVSLEGKDAEILGIQREACRAAKVEHCLGLDAEAATHIVVALDDVEVVALGTTQQNSAQEDALLSTGERCLGLLHRKHKTRTERCGLADAVGCEVGAVLDGFGVIIAEVLIETELTIHALGVFVLCRTIDKRRTPQTTHDVDVVDDGLAATKGECSIEVEEVERLGVLFAIDTRTIDKADVYVRAVVATEQGTIVSHIAKTGRERCLDGYRVEVVIVIVPALDTPGIAAEDTMESLNGVQQSSHCLTPETVPTARAVVEWRKTQAVQCFTNGHTATGGSEEVVNGRRIGLAEEFPFCRTQQGEGSCLPIAQAVGTRRIEVEVAMIGVGEHVHGEQVVIPHHTPAEVVADAIQRSLYEGFLQQITVHQMHADIDAGYFEGCSPEALLGFKSHRAIARLLIFFSYLLP